MAKEMGVKNYDSSKSLEKPNIFTAFEWARELKVNMNYLFGLDWGELVYPYPQTVSSLLINLFRTLMM